MFRFFVVGCTAILFGCGGADSGPGWGTSAKGDDRDELTLTAGKGETGPQWQIHVVRETNDACRTMTNLFHLEFGGSSATLASPGTIYDGARSVYQLQGECTADRAHVEATYTLRTGEVRNWTFFVVGTPSADSPGRSFGGAGANACQPKGTTTRLFDTEMQETTTIVASPGCRQWLKLNSNYPDNQQAIDAIDQIPDGVEVIMSNTYQVNADNTEQTIVSSQAQVVGGSYSEPTTCLLTFDLASGGKADCPASQCFINNQCIPCPPPSPPKG